jgi:CMP/dCMP kinase
MGENKVVAPVIAVDGPSGAGKGTVCRLLAKKVGYQLLDSGALYRLTALAAMRRSVSTSDEGSVASIAASLGVVFSPTATGVKTLLDGDDVTAEIRTEEVGMQASVVAALPAVRAALLARQRAFATLPGLVADGRDMGTVVFPSANVKVFLTASAEERARRRYLQLRQAGQSAGLAVILKDIQDRDERDANRAAAPLRPAVDALILDSTSLTIEQVVDEVMALINSKLGCIN